MQIAIAITIALISSSAIAQTIYKCGNSYSETACPEAKTVEIVPTDGAHSMSGKKRISQQSMHREFF